MRPNLYFGYGSNLDLEDWTAFCFGHGFDPMVLRPLRPATLDGEALVLDYRSIRRGCGALNIEARHGSAVEGVLFEVGDWAALDLKEGHPSRYRREAVVVRDAAGTRVPAQTYRVVPAMRGGLVAPNAAYLSICRAGRARFGLPLEDLETAAALAAPR